MNEHPRDFPRPDARAFWPVGQRFARLVGGAEARRGQLKAAKANDILFGDGNKCPQSEGLQREDPTEWGESECARIARCSWSRFAARARDRRRTRRWRRLTTLARSGLLMVPPWPREPLRHECDLRGTSDPAHEGRPGLLSVGNENWKDLPAVAETVLRRLAPCVGAFSASGMNRDFHAGRITRNGRARRSSPPDPHGSSFSNERRNP
jgi:hypothetical protein